MSVTKRKIGFYTLKLVDKKNPKKTWPSSHLRPLLERIAALPKSKRIYTLDESHRFHFLDKINSEDAILELLFKSAKYHHRPPLVDLAASERENPKTLSEGESESTHISIKFLDEEAILLLEERRAGIALQALINYINRFSRIFAHNDKIAPPWHIVDGVIPKGDFLVELKKLKRAKLGEVHVDKQVLGDECLDFSNRLEETQSDLVLTVRAKRQHTLQSLIMDVHRRLVAKNSRITKIRVYGLSKKDNPVLLDTDMVKQIEYTEVDLNNETGVVDGSHLFVKFRSFLEHFK